MIDLMDTTKTRMGAISLIATLVMGILAFTTSGCTTTDVTSDILSSTTPSSGYTRDGLLKADEKSAMFVHMNFENLKHDIAVGQGEYVASISSLLGVSSNSRDEFFMLMQERYPIIFDSGQTTPSEMLAALTQGLNAHLNFSRANIPIN